MINYFLSGMITGASIVIWINWVAIPLIKAIRELIKDRKENKK